MIVMKFGGTSVGSGERIARVASLVQRRDGPTVVVMEERKRTTALPRDTTCSRPTPA